MSGVAQLPPSRGGGLRLALTARHVVPGALKVRGPPGYRGEHRTAAAAAGSEWKSYRRAVFASVAAAGTMLATPQRGGRRNLAGAAVAAEVSEMRPAKRGDDVLVRYTGKFEDGKVFEESGLQPVSFRLGDEQVVPGFEKAVFGMCPGDKKSVTLKPSEAYGDFRPELVINITKEQVPAGMEVGMKVNLGGLAGQTITATVKEMKAEGGAVLDCNPPMAGKTLVFDIELVGFRQPPKRGQEMVGWGGKKIMVPNAIVDSKESQAVAGAKWPEKWPYTAADFRRQDESDDVDFYAAPRYVTHIDDAAISSIKTFYGAHFAAAPQGEYAILDLCSSWISHYPEDLKAKRVAITGMNEPELASNKQATEHQVKNLNKDPTLPYGDNEFDFITNVVSVDYLNKPKEIFQEMHRVMKPGGVAIMSFSNRCFGTKAIAMWLRDMSDGPGHCKIIGSYFHFCPDGGWKDIQAADISPNPGRGDPMWVVTAVKA